MKPTGYRRGWHRRWFFQTRGPSNRAEGLGS